MSGAPANRTLSLFHVCTAMFHLQFFMRGTQRIPNYITTGTNIFGGSARFTPHISHFRDDHYINLKNVPQKQSN